MAELATGTPEELLTLTDDDHVITEGQGVTIVVYGDFQCPFTGQAEREMRGVLAREDDVCFAYRHFPLSKHRDAFRASCAAEVAGRHGRFWDMYDLLFEQDGALDRADLRACAERLGIDGAAFDAELDDPQVAAHVERDLATGRALGVTGTPTFFVDGTLYHGDHSVELIRDWVRRARNLKA